jgi:glycosyltransferase involved in cell wall biosynthesis
MSTGHTVPYKADALRFLPLLPPINEVVVAGETGWLVGQDDVEGLRKVLMDILGDRKTLVLGQNGFKRVTQEFPVSKMVQAYGGIYGDLG